MNSDESFLYLTWICLCQGKLLLVISLRLYFKIFAFENERFWISSDWVALPCTCGVVLPMCSLRNDDWMPNLNLSISQLTIISTKFTLSAFISHCQAFVNVRRCLFVVVLFYFFSTVSVRKKVLRPRKYLFKLKIKTNFRRFVIITTRSFKIKEEASSYDCFAISFVKRKSFVLC